MASTVIFVALLVCAALLLAVGARVLLGPWSTYLAPTAPRSAFALEATSDVVFAGGLLLEAIGLRSHEGRIGLLGTLAILAAIAIGYVSRSAARRTTR